MVVIFAFVVAIVVVAWTAERKDRKKIDNVCNGRNLYRYAIIHISFSPVFDSFAAVFRSFSGHFESFSDHFAWF